MFIRSVEKFHSNAALIGSDASLVSYRQLLKLASNVARKLPTRKLVFLVCSTDIDSIVAYTSLIMTNALGNMPLDPLSTPWKYPKAIEHGGEKYIRVRIDSLEQSIVGQ